MRNLFVMLCVVLSNVLLGNVVFSDDFETGQISTGKWSFEGNADWVTDATEKYEGAYSARSGGITNNQYSGMKTTVNILEGENVKVSFYYKVSSELNWDLLKIYVNNQLIESYSGEINWTFFEYNFISDSVNVLKFEYFKDGSLSSGNDCAWIDNVKAESSSVLAPTFSLASGIYSTETVLYFLTDYENCSIYYTDNGSEPDSSSQPYDSNTGIVFTNNVNDWVTFKAILYNSENEPSNSVTERYFIGNSGLTGEISGTLFKSMSPYYVLGSLEIPDSLTLVIEPGVEVLFKGNYKLIVKGCLRALGDESNRIVFRIEEINDSVFDDYDTNFGGWGGIEFAEIANYNDPSELNYCTISYVKDVYGTYDVGAIFIYNNLAGITISNSIIANNVSSYYGGGIVVEYSETSNIIIENNTVENNISFGYGGGICVYRSSPQIRNNLIQNNKSYIIGGGIACYNWSNPEIIGNAILNNICGYDQGKSADSAIYSSLGGGISILYYSNPTVSNNTISSNSSSYGSGIYCQDTSAEFYNNYLNDNISKEITDSTPPYGFFVLERTEALVINNTILSNENTLYINESNTVLKNNIIHGNNSGVDQFSGDLLNSEFYNCLIQNGQSNLPEGWNGIYQNCLDADPELDSANGFSLKPSSPCINFGDNSVLSSSGFPVTDIEGNPRVYGDRIDIGAYEYQGVPTRNAAPEFSHISGAYFNTQFVEITSGTAGAEIRYTTDGTEPNNNSILYQPDFPVKISDDTVIKARAYGTLDPSVTNYTDIRIIRAGEVYGRWLNEASPIFVEGDLIVPEGKELAIDSGVVVIFKGNYELRVLGRINATGTADDFINFTIADTTGFSNNTSNAGGWKGINVINSVNDNRFEYCRFSYGKKLVSVSQDEYKNGGLIYLKNSKSEIRNCVFRYGKSENGGAVFADTADINISGCVISNNYSKFGAAVNIKGSLSGGTGRIINSTLSKNYYANFDSNGAISFSNSAIAEVTNVILYENYPLSGNPVSIYSNNSVCAVSYCLIEGGVGTIAGNYTAQNILDADPRFTGTGLHPYSLLASSPCVNMGDNPVAGFTESDLAGNHRVYENKIDIGAYELQTEAFSNPVLKLTETKNFTFTGDGEIQTLGISNQGNDTLKITFSFEGIGNSFVFEEYEALDTLALGSFDSYDLKIKYTPEIVSESYYDLLNYSSNDLGNNYGSIELFGGEIGQPNLTIDSVSVPAEGWMTGQPTEVSWTVKNIGDAPADTKWTDRISLVRKMDVENDVVVVTKNVDFLQFLIPGAQYTNKIKLDVPIDIDVNSDYYVKFVTNANQTVISDPVENNTVTSDPITIIRAPGADFVVSGTPERVPVSTDPVGAATEIGIKWTVKNIGDGQPDAGKWFDSVYLSPDSSLNVNINPLLGKFEALLPDSSGMANEDSLTMTAVVTIPHFANIGAGYIYIVTDSDNNVYEGGTGELNNVSVPIAITVTETGLPDLVSEVTLNESADGLIFTGDTILITGKVNNVYNNNPPFESSCRDRIYLSKQNPDSITDFDPLDAFVLATYRKTGIDTLLVSDGMTEASYSYQMNLTVPLNTGIDADSLYFDSYLFSNPEIARNTLKYFGIDDIEDDEIEETVSKLKKASLHRAETIKSDSKLDQDSRDYFLYMFTDYDNKVYEGHVDSIEEKNNISKTPVKLKISPWADLKVDTVSVDNNSLMPGDTLSVTWEVINQGDTIAFAGWTDKIYISPESKWDKDKSKLLEEVRIRGNLDTLKGSNTYSKTVLLKLPENILHNGEYYSQKYIHIYTDAYNEVYERTDESNNLSDDLITTIDIGIPPSDLEVDSLISWKYDEYHPQVAKWKVTNRGEKTFAKSWTDRIELLTLDGKKVADIGMYGRTGSLDKDSSYTQIKALDIPKTVETGDYKIRLTADVNNNVNDTLRANNFIISEDTVHVVQRKSDLVVTNVKIIKADSDSTNYKVYAGQMFAFSYTVLNQGTHYTDIDGWLDGFYLSRDTNLDYSDLMVGSKIRRFEKDENGSPYIVALGPKEFYTDTAYVTLTTQAFGDYYFMVKADMQDDVFEYMAESNNSNYQYVNVNYTDAVDLAVTEVAIPDTVSLEEETTVNYKVTNHGEFPAKGLIRDAFYVSADSIWSYDDRLVTFLDREIELDPQDSVIISAKADFTRTLRTDSKGNPLTDSKDEMSDYLPGLEPGSYYIIVRTNITLSIREDINDSLKMANNICPSNNPFTVTLPEITIGTRKDDTLAKEGVKYYQITVPDTSGVSLRVQLDRKYTKNSKSDAGTFNEMYIKYGSMPTLNNYDESYGNPYSAKQEIIVPDTRPGIYYLMVKNNYHSAPSQDITIDASLLGFELLYIDQTRGGNGGELTIKMTGTGFNYGVKPRLIKSGSGLNKTIDAKETYYTDATELYATFNLKGADQGSYDAVLVQDMSRYEFIYEDMLIETTDGDTVISVPVDMYLVPDSIVTSLPTAFMIEPSTNRGFLEYKNIPENVRGGRGFESSVEVTNISNNDMIAPLYMLKVGWNEQVGPISTKLPGEDKYTPGYKKFLILADEGPAGIIRPGAKGSVRIYATAPAVNEYMRFNMMKIQNSGVGFDFDAELFWTGADKNDPNWIETIYAIEQEVGNSWEGYNRVLVNQILEFDANSPTKKCLANKILLDNISFTKLKQNAEASKGKSGTPEVKMPSREEIIESFMKNYCSDCGKGDDCSSSSILGYKYQLWKVILGFYAAKFDHAAHFLRHYIGHGIFLDNIVGPGFPDTIDVLAAFSYNYHPRKKKIDSTAEKDELKFRDIHDKTIEYLEEWIEYKLKKDKNCFNGVPILLHHRYFSNDYEVNPFVEMKKLTTYDQYSEFPHPSFYFITKLSGQQDYITLVDIFLNKFEFRPEGRLFWAFGAMLGTDYVNAIVTTKYLENEADPLCSEDKHNKIDYTVELEYGFRDYYTFSDQDFGKSDFDKAAFLLNDCGEAKSFPTYLKIEFDFTGTVILDDK